MTDEFPATTSYLQFSRSNLYKFIVAHMFVFCYAKRQFISNLFMGLCSAHSL